MEQEQRIEAFREDFERTEEEIGKMIVGIREVVRGVLTCYRDQIVGLTR